MDWCPTRHLCGIVCAVWANGKCAPQTPAEPQLRHLATVLLVKGSDSYMAEDQKADNICAAVEEEAQQGDPAITGWKCWDFTFEVAHSATICIPWHQHVLLPVSQVQRSQG